MGLKTVYIEETLRQVTEYITHHKLPPVYYDELPSNTGQFDCIILDATAEHQGIVRANPDKWDPQPVGTIRSTPRGVIIGRHQKRLTEFLFGPIYSPFTQSLRGIYYLFDNGKHVPCIKSIEHERRDYAGYTQDDLVTLGIVRDPDHPDRWKNGFGVDRLWGQLDKLWAVRETRRTMNEFFLESTRQALVQYSRPLTRRIQFVIDPPNRDDVIITGFVGASLEKPLIVPVRKPTGGEADLKMREYLSPSFGKRFLLRSNDGDWLANLLAYLEELDSAGSTLPDIWIDRMMTNKPPSTSNKEPIDTGDKSAKKKKKSSSRRVEKVVKYIHVTALFRAIKAIAHNDNTSLATYATRLPSCVLPIVCLWFLGGNDYVQPFNVCGNFKPTPTIYGAVTTMVKATTLRGNHYKSMFWLEHRTGEEGGCRPVIDEDRIVHTLYSRYNTAQQTEGLLNDLRANVRRLQWAFLYTFNQHTTKHTDIPTKLQSLECCPQTGLSLWGWHLIAPSEEQESKNSNMIMTEIRLDAPYRHLILNPTLAKSNRTTFQIEVTNRILI